MASLAPVVVMCHNGQNYYESECEVVKMNGRYAYKAHSGNNSYVNKFTTESNYDMYSYNKLRLPPDKVVSKMPPTNHHCVTPYRRHETI